MSQTSYQTAPPRREVVLDGWQEPSRANVVISSPNMKEEASLLVTVWQSSPEQRERLTLILGMYSAGLTMRVIAGCVGVKRPQVGKIIRRSIIIGLCSKRPPLRRLVVPITCVCPALPDMGPCWYWNGQLDTHGYGRMRLNGRSIAVHRVVLAASLNRSLDRLELSTHQCDQPSCVNPDHLRVGDAVSNAREARERKRFVYKTHCPHGHPYTGDNLVIYHAKNKTNPQRLCLTCRQRVAANKKGKYPKKKLIKAGKVC